MFLPCFESTFSFRRICYLFLQYITSLFNRLNDRLYPMSSCIVHLVKYIFFFYLYFFFSKNSFLVLVLLSLLPSFLPTIILCFYSPLSAILFSSFLPHFSVIKITFLPAGYILGASEGKWNIMYICIRNFVTSSHLYFTSSYDKN